MIMTGNKNIHFLSAADRINYGDLLFPLIFKKIAEENGYTFNNYGIVRSNLSLFGALPTKSYKILLRTIKSESGKLIIGGGEVFFADWRTLYGFINPFYSKALKYKRIAALEKKIRFSKFYLCFNQVAIPFCPSKNELLNDKVKIYYNSVGGSLPYGKNKKEIENIKQALNNASLVSVRDKRTADELKKLNVNSKIVPDSAIIISSIFSKEEILENKTLDNKNLKNYIFLQLGINKGPNNLVQFALQIKKLSNELNLNVILCPIGKAPGHEDNIILKKLQLIESDFHYIEPKNIFDIMYLISNSSIYMGTSLHGLITAQSFNVPFVGLNEKLEKVNAYTTTWIGENYRSLSFEEIDKTLNIFYSWNFSRIAKKNQEQIKLVKENIFTILDD